MDEERAPALLTSWKPRFVEFNVYTKLRWQLWGTYSILRSKRYTQKKGPRWIHNDSNGPHGGHPWTSPEQALLNRPREGSPELALSRPPDNGPPAGSRPRAGSRPWVGSRPWAGTPEPAPSGLPELAPSRLPYNGPKRSSLALVQHQPPSGKINVRPPDLTSSSGLQIPVFDLKNPASRLQRPESSFRFQLHRDNSVIFKMMTKLSTKCPGNSLAKKNGSGTSLSILG